MPINLKPSHWADLYHFQAETGCRVSEALALTWECVEIIHGEDYYIPAENPAGFCTVRGRDTAIVRVQPHDLPDGSEWIPKRPASVRAMVVALEALRPAEGSSAPPGGSLVFFPGRDRPPSRQAAHKALKRLHGPEAKSHDFRRAFITRQLSEGVDPWTLARYVGHRSLRSMLPYLVSVNTPVALTCAGNALPAEHWKAALQSANWRK